MIALATSVGSRLGEESRLSGLGGPRMLASLIERPDQLQQVRGVELGRVVLVENRQVRGKLVGLMIGFREDQGAMNRHPVDVRQRFGFAGDLHRDRVHARTQVNVHGIGQRAGLPIAEIPADLGPGGRSPGRDRAELNADQGDFVAGQRHLAGNVHRVFVQVLDADRRVLADLLGAERLRAASRRACPLREAARRPPCRPLRPPRHARRETRAGRWRAAHCPCASNYASGPCQPGEETTTFPSISRKLQSWLEVKNWYVPGWLIRSVPLYSLRNGSGLGQNGL